MNKYLYFIMLPIIVTKDLTSYRQIPYYFGNNPIYKVMINGELID